MNHKYRGIALLFLNKFQNTKYPISGHEEDKEQTKNCLENLGFIVTVHENKTAKETIDLLTKNAKADYSNADCLLCVFSSHGNESGFVANDMQSIDLTSTILEIFPGNKSLIRKPKLFFINACRGDKIMQQAKSFLGTGTGPGPGSVASTPEICDIMIYYSTLPKYVSFGNVTGSRFIQAFVEVFNEYGKKEQLMDMVTRINQKIANLVLTYKDKKGISHFNCKQMSTLVEYSLTKRVFFK